MEDRVGRWAVAAEVVVVMVVMLMLGEGWRRWSGEWVCDWLRLIIGS